MSLDAIPAGARTLVDANVLIYAKRGMSEECRRFLQRCARSEVSGVITTITLGEFCHRRMMQEAQSRGLVSSNPAKSLSQNSAVVRNLTQYQLDVEDLLAGVFAIVSIDAVDFRQAIELQRRYGLLTNDSLLLAAGLRIGAKNLVTADPQFDGIPGISVFKPGDL